MHTYARDANHSAALMDTPPMRVPHMITLSIPPDSSKNALKHFNGSDSDLFHVTSDPLPNRILLRASPLIHTTSKLNHNAKQFRDNRISNKKPTNSNDLSTTTINTFNENYLTLGNQSFETSNDEYYDNPPSPIKQKTKFNNDKPNQNSIKDQILN